MKIYLLKRVNEDKIYYDEYISKVVSAKNEEEARSIANQETADEGKIWNNPKKVDCRQITSKEPKGIILSSFRAG